MAQPLHNRIGHLYHDLNTQFSPEVSTAPISIYHVKGGYHVCQFVDGQVHTVQLKDRKGMIDFIKRCAEIIKKGE